MPTVENSAKGKRSKRTRECIVGNGWGLEILEWKGMKAGIGDLSLDIGQGFHTRHLGFWDDGCAS